VGVVTTPLGNAGRATSAKRMAIKNEVASSNADVKVDVVRTMHMDKNVNVIGEVLVDIMGVVDVYMDMGVDVMNVNAMDVNTTMTAIRA